NVLHFRKLKEQGEKYHHLKQQLPCVKPSGIFHTSDGDHLIRHSGWMQIDLDRTDNPEFLADPEDAKKELSKFPEVGFAARSTTDGIWALVRLPYEEIDEEDHEAYFNAMSRALKHYGINPDESGKNTGRLRFYSYDPDPVWKSLNEVRPFDQKLKPESDQNSSKDPQPIRLTSGIRSIEEARRIIEDQGHEFRDGNKHHYLFHLAAVCNKMGIEKGELEDYVDENLMSISEVTTNCIEDPYERFEDEWGTWE
ncbi:MAG: BT4734/BF3469 family protein, partial [Flavobacteriales bacterium]